MTDHAASALNEISVAARHFAAAHLGDMVTVIETAAEATSGPLRDGLAEAAAIVNQRRRDLQASAVRTGSALSRELLGELLSEFLSAQIAHGVTPLDWVRFGDDVMALARPVSEVKAAALIELADELERNGSGYILRDHLRDRAATIAAIGGEDR